MSGTPGPVRGADVEAALAVAATPVATAAAPVATLVPLPQVGSTEYLQISLAHHMLKLLLLQILSTWMCSAQRSGS